MIVGLIPARGGSKRLVNKNLLPIGGIPLLVRAIHTIRPLVDKVYVSTEDPTIASLAFHHGVDHLSRPAELFSDTATVDQVVAHHFGKSSDSILVYQPTMVGVEQADIKRMMDQATVPSALAVGVHGIWKDNNTRLDKRVNTQDATAYLGAELGVRYYPKGAGDGSIKTIFPVSSVPVFDIDTPSDFAAAESFLNRRRISIRFIHSKRVGSGHYRRALTLAERLQHHSISMVQVSVGLDAHTDDRVEIPPEFQSDPGYVPDLIINDVLDTTESEMAELRRLAPVIAFEDLGPGARLASAVVNDLYESDRPEYYTGHRYSILRPEFLARPPMPIAQRIIPILVSFGGTDPNDLTAKTHDLLGDRAKYIAPPGSGRTYDFGTISGHMAPLLADTKLLITSAGRTVYEAAALGTPALVIAQNTRETTHTHLGPQWGNWYLGPHHFVNWKRIKKAGEIPTEALQEMSEVAYNRMDHKGLDRVVALIESVLLEAR